MAIGNTPLIKLERLSEPGCAEIYVKYEGANPTGSMKDRMALSMVEGAEKRGELKPGGTVMDYTGGSTGSSLAMVCANRGYKAYFVSSDAFAEEKLQTMRAFGATLEIFPSEGGKISARLIDSMVARAKELSSDPNTFWTDQFNNVDNRNAYHNMAREIITSLGNEYQGSAASQLNPSMYGRFREVIFQARTNLKELVQVSCPQYAGSTWRMRSFP